MTLERMQFADLHQDRINPQLADILQNPEFQYAAERQRQLPAEGLKKLDLTFASLYRRATGAIKEAAKTGNEEVIGDVREEIGRMLDYYHSTQDFRIIEKPEDLQLSEGEYDRNNIVLHLEGGDILTSPEIVDQLYERGVRSVGPVYSHDNQIGGGASGNIHRGLTALGKRIIDRLIEKGMVVDIAHANRRTASDILERVGNYSKAVASHTAMGRPSKETTGHHGLVSPQRFISKELLQKIAQKGGVVGFTLANPFFESFAKYIDTYKKAADTTGSAEHLAVATDFGGMDAQHLFAEFDEIGKLSLIAEKLSEQGQFSDEEIAKIMYGNVERIVKQL